MAALTLSQAEYLVILDILHAENVIGLDSQSLFPADRDTHRELIHQGIRRLESRGLVEIRNGRHIIERRLLEMVSIVARPQVVITTLRDRAGIGTQLYLHYQAGDGVIEQVLPDESQYSLGQLPDVTSAFDRIVRMLDLPTESCDFRLGQTIQLTQLNEAQARLESGDYGGAMASLISAGWPADFAESYLATLDGRILTGQVNIMTVIKGLPGETLSLTLITRETNAWLLTPHPANKKWLQVRQVNAASFRDSLEKSYSAVYRQSQVQP